MAIGARATNGALRRALERQRALLRAALHRVNSSCHRGKHAQVPGQRARSSTRGNAHSTLVRACYAIAKTRSLRCAAHNFFGAKKRQSQVRSQSKSTRAEFLDGLAQGIILTVIFQAIDAKFCNRASFRHDV
jgi:hypothetical protein